MKIQDTVWGMKQKAAAAALASKQADMLRKMHEAPVRDPAMGTGRTLLQLTILVQCESMCGSCELTECIR